MENETLIKKRYVTGLRNASIVLTFNLIVALVTSIFVPFYSTWAQQVIILASFISLSLSACIAVFVTQKNYNYMLGLVFFVFVFFSVCRQYSQEMEAIITQPFERLGGQLADYLFIWATTPMIVAILFARFYLAVFLILFVFLQTTIDIVSFVNEQSTFFTFDFNVMASEIGAMNGFIFIQNSTLLLVATLSLIFIAWNMERSLKEATDQERSNNLLGRYFSPEVRDEIEKNKLNFDQTSEKEQNIAVMFTDISNFTKLSEGLEPKKVLDLLSEYQTKMVAAVFQNGGSVDKFIGDSVMATFGTPVSRGNDAQNALNCIRQMQISMREWEKQREDEGLPVIKHRIGVHFGPCFVGNVGSEDRVEFTVIGDTVNVASRICEACKEVKSDVLISDDVKLRLSENLPTEEVKNFQVRGRDKKITLHKLIV